MGSIHQFYSRFRVSGNCTYLSLIYAVLPPLQYMRSTISCNTSLVIPHTYQILPVSLNITGLLQCSSSFFRHFSPRSTSAERCAITLGQDALFNNPCPSLSESEASTAFPALKLTYNPSNPQRTIVSITHIPIKYRY